VRRHTHLFEFVIKNFEAISVLMGPKGVVKREWQGQDCHGVCDGKVGEREVRFSRDTRAINSTPWINYVILSPLVTDHNCCYARGHL
jgi:hypothetical protein